MVTFAKIKTFYPESKNCRNSSVIVQTCPTALQVDAYPTLWRCSMVNAHPSTAMSWVAARKLRKKNRQVRVNTSGVLFTLPWPWNQYPEISSIVAIGNSEPLTEILISIFRCHKRLDGISNDERMFRSWKWKYECDNIYLQIEVDIFWKNEHCGSDEVLNGYQPRLPSPKLPNEDRVDDGCP